MPNYVKCDICGGGVWPGAKTNFVKISKDTYIHAERTICQSYKATEYARRDLEYVHSLQPTGYISRGRWDDYLTAWLFQPTVDAPTGPDASTEPQSSDDGGNGTEG